MKAPMLLLFVMLCAIGASAQEIYDLLLKGGHVIDVKNKRNERLDIAITGERVQANKAIVGRNAFAHEAGVHQDGILKDRRTYEIMRPEDVGVARTSLVLGKHSGRHALRARCERLGVALTRAELETAYRQMLAVADARKHVTDEDLVNILSTVAPSQGLPAAAEPSLHEDGYGFGV